jgi:hypothetical protein
MDLSDTEVQHLPEADRREVDPPIEVEMASWSPGGQLDWWVKERREWFGRYAVRTAVNGGSALVIFVPRAAQSRDLPIDEIVLVASGTSLILGRSWTGGSISTMANRDSL